MSVRVDTEVIEARLRELSRRLRRVAAKKPASLKLLTGDEDLQDILSRNLELAIRTCVDIAAHLCGAYGLVPATAGDTFELLSQHKLLDRALAKRLRRAVGFRNVLVHEYVEVDWTIVMRVISGGTKDLAAFGKAVLVIIEKQERER